MPHRQLRELSSKVGLEGRLQMMELGGKEHFGYVARIESVYGSDEFLGLLVPVEETLHPYMEKVHFSLLVTLGRLLLLAPLVWYCATIIVKPINGLAHLMLLGTSSHLGSMYQQNPLPCLKPSHAVQIYLT